MLVVLPSCLSFLVMFASSCASRSFFLMLIILTLYMPPCSACCSFCYSAACGCCNICCCCCDVASFTHPLHQKAKKQRPQHGYSLPCDCLACLKCYSFNMQKPMFYHCDNSRCYVDINQMIDHSPCHQKVLKGFACYSPLLPYKLLSR